MAYELKDLVVDRVDLVDEGANSAAFIELYKRKETLDTMELTEILSKLKPEHADVINKALSDAKQPAEQLTKDNADLTKRIADLEEELEKAKRSGCKKSDCQKADCEGCKEYEKSAGASFDETESMLKSMPEAARAMFEQLRQQKELAEEQVRKNAAEKAEAEAVAKAASLKALPVAQDKLVDIIKNCDNSVIELLSTINTAIEATVLDEVGKNAGNGAGKTESAATAWAKLESRAEEVAKSRNTTKEKAMAIVVAEEPALYREYLEEGM